MLSDTLSALLVASVTPDLIKELKLGKIVSTLKEKLESVVNDKSARPDAISKANKLSGRCKEILLIWKRLIDEVRVADARKIKSTVIDGTKAVLVSPLQTTMDVAALSVARKQVLAILTNNLKNGDKSNANSVADRIASAIEAEIHSKHSNEKDYLAKAKSLSFNMKKNEVI